MATKPELKRAIANTKIKASDYNFNFDKLNDYIENGIADNAINFYDPDRAYKKGQWVMFTGENGSSLYESLIDGNKGNSLTDNNFWVRKTFGFEVPLLQSFWSDHILNRPDLLLADTFSWQSGKLYEAVYNKLVAEYDNENSVEETEGGITFKRTPNRYKIVDKSQETAILNKYNTDGIAWYYILDKDNTQFKLPRTKFGFEGLRGSVGNDIQAGLPNITGEMHFTSENNESDGGAIRQAFGAFDLKPLSSEITGGTLNRENTQRKLSVVTYNASRSSAIYGNSNTVQPPATQMYLYFYVGNYTQTAIEQTAGINTELFNNKADKTEIDGEWVMLPEAIALLQNISLNNTSYIPVSIDLTTFLPNDNYNYEILLTADMLTNSSSSASGQCNVCANEDCKNLVGICGEVTRTANSAYAKGSAILPLQNNSRTIYLQRANYHATLNGLYLNAYRRLGKIGV